MPKINSFRKIIFILFLLDVSYQISTYDITEEANYLSKGKEYSYFFPINIELSEEDTNKLISETKSIYTDYGVCVFMFAINGIPADFLWYSVINIYKFAYPNDLDLENCIFLAFDTSVEKGKENIGTNLYKFFSNPDIPNELLKSRKFNSSKEEEYSNYAPVLSYIKNKIENPWKGNHISSEEVINIINSLPYHNFIPEHKLSNDIIKEFNDKIIHYENKYYYDRIYFVLTNGLNDDISFANVKDEYKKRNCFFHIDETYQNHRSYLLAQSFTNQYSGYNYKSQIFSTIPESYIKPTTKEEYLNRYLSLFNFEERVENYVKAKQKQKAKKITLIVLSPVFLSVLIEIIYVCYKKVYPKIKEGLKEREIHKEIELKNKVKMARENELKPKIKYICNLFKKNPKVIVCFCPYCLCVLGNEKTGNSEKNKMEDDSNSLEGPLIQINDLGENDEQKQINDYFKTVKLEKYKIDIKSYKNIKSEYYQNIHSCNHFKHQCTHSHKNLNINNCYLCKSFMRYENMKICKITSNDLEKELKYYFDISSSQGNYINKFVEKWCEKLKEKLNKKETENFNRYVILCGKNEYNISDEIDWRNSNELDLFEKKINDAIRKKQEEEEERRRRWEEYNNDDDDDDDYRYNRNNNNSNYGSRVVGGFFCKNCKNNCPYCRMYLVNSNYAIKEEIYIHPDCANPKKCAKCKGTLFEQTSLMTICSSCHYIKFKRDHCFICGKE